MTIRLGNQELKLDILRLKPSQRGSKLKTGCHCFLKEDRWRRLRMFKLYGRGRAVMRKLGIALDGEEFGCLATSSDFECASR